jgi:hypothetical protein
MSTYSTPAWPPSFPTGQVCEPLPAPSSLRCRWPCPYPNSGLWTFLGLCVRPFSTRSMPQTRYLGVGFQLQSTRKKLGMRSSITSALRRHSGKSSSFHAPKTEPNEDRNPTKTETQRRQKPNEDRNPTKNLQPISVCGSRNFRPY